MKKGKRSLTLALSLLSIASLTACDDDYKYPKNKWEEGKIVNVGGKNYTFEQIYKLLDNTKGSAQAYYNVAKNVLAQLVTKRTDAMLATVDSKMNELKNTWKTNARTNRTSYKEEMEKTLDSESVDDIDELRNKYIAQAQNDENSTAYYNINADGTTDKSYKFYISEEMTKNYVKEQAPYHVSHILIKVDASSDGEGLWNGKISSDDAKQIGNVARMLASNDSFGSIALIASDDEGSAKQYGELFTSTDGSEQVAMEKTTSYINEFKLGLYAYDTFLNPNTKSNAEVRTSLRVPGDNVATSAVKDTIKNVLIGSNAEEGKTSKAFGIPLSVALTMGYVAETEKNMVDNTKVDYAQETQYPRNVLFNNYFNYHGVNFMYDDRDEYDEKFLTEAKEIGKVAFGNTDSDGKSIDSWTLDDVKAKLKNKYAEYEYVRGQLDKIDQAKFQEIDGVSDNLVEYKYNASTGRSEYTSITGSKKVLVEKDGTKNPVIIVRGGSSSYQGIHFIVVNNDPFENADNKYQYYRTNIPSASESDKTKADSDSYEKNASFINFVTTDVNSNTTYNTRRDALYKSIKKANSNIEFNLYESNKAAFKSAYNVDFDTLLGDYSKLVNRYIDTTRDSSQVSANDSLDESWETYIRQLSIQEDVSPRGIVPQVCISAFEGGNFDGKENLCHVEK